MATKKWTAVDYDAAKYLSTKAAPLKRVTLPKTLKLQVTVELDDKLYAALAKNPTWLAKLQQAAGNKAREALDVAAKSIMDTEAKAAKFDPKTAAIFTKSLQTSLEKSAQVASEQMADLCEKLIVDYKKGQKDLVIFKVKCGGKIVATTLLVAAGATVSVVSAGSLSPLGIVAVVRGGVSIAQEITKLALKIDQVAKLVQGELRVLKKLMNEENAKAKKSGKVAQGAKEIGLNILSKVVGLETPSLKNCEGHIGIHKVNIAKIEAESKKLSQKIYGAMDEQTKLAKGVAAARKTLPAEKVGKVAVLLDKSELALDSLLKATIKINEAVTAAGQRQETYEKALRE